MLAGWYAKGGLAEKVIEVGDMEMPRVSTGMKYVIAGRITISIGSAKFIILGMPASPQVDVVAHGHKAANARACANRLGVGRVILLSLDVGLHVGRWHQAHGVAKRLQLARPKVR